MKEGCLITETVSTHLEKTDFAPFAVFRTGVSRKIWLF